MVTGSTASAIHGIPRFTADVDLVVSLEPDQVADLAAELRNGFYIDEDTARLAVLTGRSFNVIHLASVHKFDLFPLTADAYQQRQFARRQYVWTVLPGGPIEMAAATPEDVILSKLRWFRQGGAVLQTQWEDARGIVAVQGARLDRGYLREWAEYLHVEDLLARLLEERPTAETT
jgi:hypothetical protein